ncbi:MAG: SDR family oxidoreductase [Fimbriimonadaceae bacterium]|nr:SDR family oxidoreductase [Fimbriimonadaceae bacterium]
MAGRLAGKIAVVTGSTSGIGAGIVQRFAAEGAAVVVSGRRPAEGESVVAQIRAAGGEASFCQTDVAVPADCRHLIAAAGEAYGGLDILVNNAGIFPRCRFLDTTVEFWDEVLNINVRGAFLCCQAAVPLMQAGGGGSIINVGSCNAFTTGDALFAYGVSKGALWTLTQNLAKNLAPLRIRANWISVGWVLTEKELEVQAKEGRTPDDLQAGAAQRPMGEYNTVDDIAWAAVYLASDEAIRVSGSDLNASAGMRIRA